MPIIWSLPPIFSVNGQGLQTVKLTESLRVTAKSQSLRRSDSIAEFAGNVEATFGVTRVNADQITFFMPAANSKLFLRKAIANGNVTLVDPDGTISAQRLEFDWETGKGTATQAVINLAGMELRVAEIEIQPGQWTLNSVNAVLCDDRHIGFASKRLVYRPSERAEFYDAQLKILGNTIVGLKKHSFDLGPDGRTSMWPDIVIGGSKGVGVQWTGRYAISDHLRFATKFGFASSSKPWGEAYLIQGLLPTGTTIRTPRSDTSEVANHGYFENINVRDPGAEFSSEREVRGSLSLGTSWNRGQYADLSGEISKPFELILEAGGKLSEFGWSTQIRYHRLDQVSADDLDRIIGLATLSFPRVALTKDTFLVSRLDARAFDSMEAGNGGWIRGQLGLVSKIGMRASIGVAYSDSSHFGEQPLAIETLDSKRSYHARFDIGGESTKVSALFKYDPDGQGWYDHEFSLRQAAGCIEPFISFRERPRRITFGFSLRPLEKVQRLEESTSKRVIGNHLPPN